VSANGKLLNSPRALVAVALASFLATLPHSFEDFVEGVPLCSVRFEITCK
jgi:hypothetical protein